MSQAQPVPSSHGPALGGGRPTLLPAGMADFLRRRALEVLGLGLIALAVLLALALISYDAADPSWNNASAAQAHNWLGSAGAHVADLLLQTLGLAAALISLVLMTWAWRLLAHRALPWFALNLALLPASLFASAAVLAAVARPAGWPLASGLGGWLGDMGLGLAGRAALELGLMAPWLVALGFALVALPALYFTLGLGLGEWHRLGRSGWRGVVVAWRLTTALNNLGGWLERRLETHRQRRNRVRREPILEATKAHGESAPQAEALPPVTTVRETVRKRVAKSRNTRAGKREEAERQETLDLGPIGDYQLPALSLLKQPSRTRHTTLNDEALEKNARMLEAVLRDFGVKGEITEVRPGPVVTLYELEPGPSMRTSRVIGLADDIARSMSAISARIAVIPGKNAIGIELPNAESETVYLRQLLASEDYENTVAQLSLALGKDISGRPVVADLTRMPHLLVAGTTGSGKSVGVNSMILSLLYRLPPEKCKLILIDPKMLELSVYDGIPHLLTPVVTEPGKAVVALKWTVREMEDRYRAMAQLGVRNISGYNKRLEEAQQKGETLKRTVQTGFDADTGEPVFEEQELDLKPLPFIVVVVDEMADLMLVAGKDIETAIQRLSQMARAAGIHLIMATQRPSVDVITGTIKANFPTRISFQVTSKIDSRTILGEQGAEQLLGSGDMLFMAGGGRIKRVHGPFVSDREVEGIVKFLKKQGRPQYLEAVTEEPDPLPGMPDSASSGGDELYDQAVALVCREGKASTSFVQRHLQIGYNRAARIIEGMESEGVISAANRVGKREVLARDIDALE
ncbi:MAG TPA: DNA translocase FtsK 4TM domain-containing protein [Alphaproteobacteria bacterium]|nr:DNA translocase FtsK 4TM domain-containing protein [Alphaproteobacteria bacterium]